MIRHIHILLAVCATALALSGCLGTPMNNPSATYSEKTQYLTNAYREISDTKLTRMEAWNYCNKHKSQAWGAYKPDPEPKRYAIRKGIGNTYHATETAAPQSPAGAFLKGFSEGLARNTAGENAHESCMLQLGYMKQEGYRPTAAPPNRTGSSASTVNENIHEYSNDFICSKSLPARGRGIFWQPTPNRYVSEAIRRGYTPECCAEHLGRTTATTLDECKSANKVTTSRKVKIFRADLTPEERCVLDLKKSAGNSGAWPKSCAQMSRQMSRTTQVASNAKTTGNELASLSQESLCQTALNSERSAWDSHHVYLRSVTEAKRRGYTPESCAKVLGRTIHKTAHVKEQDKPKPKASADQDQSKTVGSSNASVKTFKRKMCESAQASEDMKASFMQSISKDELSKFLKSGQDCSIF